jgi:ABC-type uncharacterized transport system substrate-binding protein
VTQRLPAARRRSLVWLLVSLVTVGTGSANAHPHVYVVYSIVLPLGPCGVDRVGFVFTFDPMFSTTILRDASEGDPASVAANHARILRQIPHEIAVMFNGLPVELDPSIDLEATVAGGQVTYRFVVPLRAPLPAPGTIDIIVDDPGVFVAFALRGFAPVDVRAGGPFTASCSRARTPSGAPGPVRCQYEAIRQ